MKIHIALTESVIGPVMCHAKNTRHVVELEYAEQQYRNYADLDGWCLCCIRRMLKKNPALRGAVKP